MAVKPSTIPFWATGNPIDGVSGQPAILTPSAGKVVSGYTRLERPPRQDFNFNQNLNGLWVEYLDQQVDLNDTHRSSDGTDHANVGLNDTHRLGGGADHSDVALNNTHRSSPGTDHSDVGLNNTHRIGNGSDHSDVALNTTHRSSSGTDHSDVALNTTHRSSSGTDHSDVGLNNTHRTGDGSDHADVATNTTNIGNNTTAIAELNTTESGITASTTQTQGQQPLTKHWNQVSVVANTSDVVTLPSAVAGFVCGIRNDGANTLQIFPASGDKINAIAIDGALSTTAGQHIIMVAVDATQWYLFSNS